jgi:molecular chaperone DnaK
MEDLGDKLDADAKKRLEDAVAKVKETLSGTDAKAMKSATDALQKVWHEEAGKLYAANAGAAEGATAQGAAADEPSGNGDEAVDAEFEVVDDDQKK